MATPPSNETRVLFRLLADGEWHDYNDIRDRVAASVPPGPALRKYQSRLQAGRVFRGDETVEIHYTEDEQIFYGARALAQVAISSWKRRGLEVVKASDGRKQIRIKPDFPAWRFTGMGQETVSGSTEPGDEPEGYTEVPPEDSEPSEASRCGEEPVWPSPPEAYGAGRVELEAAQEQPEALSQTVNSQDPNCCTECGLAVYDESIHRDWHAKRSEELEAREMALVDESGLRTLLGDVTRLVLADFQAGMQGWLEDKFAQVESQIQAISRPQTAPGQWAQGKPWSTQR